MPDTKLYSTLRGPPYCRLFQCIALFAAYLTFLSYLIRWVSSDQTCKNNIITLSGWNCLFWEHGVNFLYFLFFAVITLAACRAESKAIDAGGVDNYEILFHAINNIPFMLWTVITWHRIGKFVTLLLGFDPGTGRPQWMERLFKIIESSVITVTIYSIIAIVLFFVLLGLAVACFLIPICMLRSLCNATSESQRIFSDQQHLADQQHRANQRRRLADQRRLEAMDIELRCHNEHSSAREDAMVREPVKGFGEHCRDEGPGDRSHRAEYDVEEARESTFSINGRDALEPRGSLCSR